MLAEEEGGPGATPAGIYQNLTPVFELLLKHLLPPSATSNKNYHAEYPPVGNGPAASKPSPVSSFRFQYGAVVLLNVISYANTKTPSLFFS